MELWPAAYGPYGVAVLELSGLPATAGDDARSREMPPFAAMSRLLIGPSPAPGLAYC